MTRDGQTVYRDANGDDVLADGVELFDEDEAKS